MFGLLVKVVGIFAIDPGSIPDSSQLRQKSGVGRKLQILQKIYYSLVFFEILFQVLIEPT